ncbi:FAD-dependent pyridine nucleotide-disulfide oxidoreductase [Magnetococcus marinus MC-1]|uniref:FAD-dependent pyridine nucleotide-disulfide oxidoreductase n=1 Tax=Magnetococcus marinus (strain ATCC BAA-1437 / JCM 17883 / MC-1) TaxID=156889 RepID=A0L9L6_MAGMM|nr:FAD-dependent pyridine nucleotide-disulfide oxidoreductase [Magnetococcus marinus MC-1]
MVMTNPYLESVTQWEFDECSFEEGTDKIVAYGEASGYCPTYQERVPPCTSACPAGEDIRGYNNIVRGVWGSDDPYATAFQRLTRKNPFPAVMGRVCPAPCQGGCNRQYRDETIGINAIEHAIGQYAIEKGLKFDKPEVASTGKHIAVVGGGVGGLSNAYQMVMRGHKVTLFDRDEKLGGMLRYGILGYRVSRAVIDAEVQRILDLGVEVKSGVTIGKDITLEQLSKDYDAVFLAVGAQKGRTIPLPGSEGKALVKSAIDFLRDFEINGGIEAGGADKVKVGKNVVVIGDGDVAMDACRLALRLGSKATLLSGVAREEMNCSAFEYDEALAEGTDMKMCTGSLEITGEGDTITGIKVIEMARKEKGEDGWNHAVPFMRYKQKAGSEATVACDMVVWAVGQTTDMAGFESCTNGTPFLQVDHNFQVKGMDNVFGGGDAVQIHLLTTAIGHGRKAAEAMDTFLKGGKLPSKAAREDVVKFDKLKSDFFVEKAQAKRKIVHPANVVGNWEETLQQLSAQSTKEEADRCMSCGMCFECNQCMLFCPQDAITKFKGNAEGEVMFTYYERCVGCHICSEVCPTGYIDMGMGN